MPILEVKQLHKSFGALEVLKGMSLNVAEGEVVALIGASGSGKSTLLRCVNRLETPTGGSVVFEGQMDAGATPMRQLPFVLRQARGHQSRLELTLGDQTAIQIYNGKAGWKVRPFTNRTEVETMSSAGSGSILLATHLWALTTSP